MKKKIRQWWLRLRKQSETTQPKPDHEMIWVNGLTAEENMRLNKILKDEMKQN